MDKEGNPASQTSPNQQNNILQPTPPQQPNYQPASTPSMTAQPAPSQPIVNDNINLNPEGQPAPLSKPKQKKTIIAIGAAIGAILLIVIIALIIIFLSSGEKTISCTSQTTTKGIDTNIEASIALKNSNISSGSVNFIVDLKSLSDIDTDQEQAMVDIIVESYREQCNDGCSFNHEYVQHDHLKLSSVYDADGIDNLIYAYNTEGMSEQEIADQIQNELESSLPGEVTCKQN